MAPTPSLNPSTMSPSGFVCLFACLIAGTAHADPELDRLKTAYEATVERAVAPVRASYEQQLQKLFERHTKAANLDAALEVKAELERIGAKNVPGSTTSAPQGSLRSELEKLFVERAWKTPTGTKFTFHSRGEGTREFGSDQTKVTWRHVSPKLIEVVNQAGAGDTWFFRFVSSTEAYYGGSKDKITLKLQPQ